MPTEEFNLEKMNNNVELLNKIFLFREEYNMQDDCILDVLEEFAFKHNMDTALLAMELADMEGFVSLVELDLKKFKYAKESNDASISDEWDS